MILTILLLYYVEILLDFLTIEECSYCVRRKVKDLKTIGITRRVTRGRSN